MEKENVFDIAVIGGGPAGMIAAGRAAQLGARVVLLEKNKKLGRKLLLTGNGRCNITNAEFDLKKLISCYGRNGKFLFRAFGFFGPEEVIKFFEERRLKTKIERGKRVFPKTEKASDVLDTLLRYLRENRVTVVCDAKVHRFSSDSKGIKKIILQNKRAVFAKNYIICTGGMAYPLTGSTGEGLRWAKLLGHTVKKQKPALVPLEIKEDWAKALQGLSLKNVELTVKNRKRSIKKMGECIFTHYGISGPIVLELSKTIGEILSKGEVKVFLDLKPALEEKKLDARIQRDFKKHSNKLFKNALYDLLPSKIIPVVIFLSGIDEDKEVNKINKEERKKIVKILKGMEMTVKNLMGFDLAITSTGGVSLSEIDEKTMRSKKISNLFFAGEVIDIDGPTGGFNLQLCWATGYLAGESAVNLLEEKEDDET